MQKFYLVSDHAGFKLKEELREHLTKQGYKVVDLGPSTDATSVSYALQGLKIGQVVADDQGSLGVAVCGSGIGISIAANKVHGIRCARITSVEDAHLSKQHNNANIIALGGRQLPIDLATRMIDEFNETEFEGGRHIERVEQLNNGE